LSDKTEEKKKKRGGDLLFDVVKGASDLDKKKT